MIFNSFRNFIRHGWRKVKSISNRRDSNRNASLLVEVLERREVLANTIPTIYATGVLPTDGSVVTTGSPTIRVAFSQSMYDANNSSTDPDSYLNPANYLILNSAGAQIQISQVNTTQIISRPNDSAVLITPAVQPLVVDTYTVFLHGDHLFGDDNGQRGFPMSQPGQLIVANQGQNNGSVVGLAGGGTLGAISHYSLPNLSGTSAKPTYLTTADFDGDTHPDLAIVNSGTDTLTIFRGHDLASGYGYSTTPDATLTLPAGSAPNAIIAADVNGDQLPDLILANGGTKNISVFLNTTSAGSMSFGNAPGSPLSLANATDVPVGLVAGDFDGNQKVDLAVAISTDDGANFNVDLFEGNGDGTFNAAVAIPVGTTGPTGVTTPSSLTSGVFTYGGTLTDLVVGGANGFLVLTNTSTPGTITFTAQPLVASATPVYSLAAGVFGAGTNADIAVATSGNNIQLYRNTSTAAGVAFSAPFAITAPGGIAATSQLAIGDLNKDGRPDLVIANGAKAGSVSILTNTTIGGQVRLASNTSPIIVSSANNGLKTGDQVSISGAAANTNVNNTFTVTILSGTGTVAGSSLQDAVVTDNNHGLQTGDTIIISGSSVAGADGVWTITRPAGAPGVNTFSLNGSKGVITTNGAVNWTSTSAFSLTSPLSTGNGVYTGGAVWGRTGNIAAANGAGGTALVTLSVPGNTFVNGQALTINGITPAGAFATALNGITFTINLKTLSGTETSQGSSSGGAITITSTNHGLSDGDIVNITGDSFVPDGSYTITKTGNDTFTLNNTSDNTNGSGTGGSWTCTNDTFELVGTAGLTGSSTTGTWTTSAGFASQTGSPYAVNSTPMGVALVDSNGDSNLDVVTVNNTGNDFSLLLGNGDGTMQVSADSSIVSTVASGVALKDVTDDGIADLIFISNNVGGNANLSQISFRQGLGNRTYAAAVPITANASGKNMRSLNSVAVGDINDDGMPDIAFTDSQDSLVGFLVNNMTAGQPNTIAANSFTAIAGISTTPAGFFSSSSPTQVVFANLNSDSLPDLVVSCNGSGFGKGGFPFQGISVLINNFKNNTIGFLAPAAYNTGRGMVGVAVGDFNHDGFQDFAGLATSGKGSARIYFNPNDQKGGFNTSNNINVDTKLSSPSGITAADFNSDGYLDLMAISSSTQGSNSGVSVLLNQGGSVTGFGTAVQANSVVPNRGLNSIAAVDVNQDGRTDAIVAANAMSGTIQTAAGPTGGTITITTSGSGLPTGFVTGLQVFISGYSGANANTINGLWTITVTGGSTFTLDNSSASGTYAKGSGRWTVVGDNVFVMTGNGDGSFNGAVPYQAGGVGVPVAPSYLAASPAGLMRVTTFTSGGTVVNPDLIINGKFENADLNSEAGNLLGWQTYDLNTSPGGSVGSWVIQGDPAKNGAGLTASPLSNTKVPAPSGQYRAMLDQHNVIPLDPSNPNYPNQTQTDSYDPSPNLNLKDPNDASQGAYTGTHTLFQQVTIPANATSAVLSFNLYINNNNAGTPASLGANGWSDPSVTSSLDVFHNANNQQVRIDIVDPSAPGYDPNSPIGVDANSGVLVNLFQTTGAQPNPTPAVVNRAYSFDLLNGANAIPASALGKPIILRFAAGNNMGRLLVGVDNVTLKVQFDDQAKPGLTGVRISSPSFISGGITYTNDPTIIGSITDNAGLANIDHVGIALNPKHDKITGLAIHGPNDISVKQFDADGNFSKALANVSAGVNVVSVQVVDKAGNVYTAPDLTFFMLSNSVSQWQPVGPQGIDVTGQPGVNGATTVDYSVVSGSITSTVADASDPLGNTYLVGSDNGGIWKSTNGGNTWINVTNAIYDKADPATRKTLPVSVSISGMTQSRTDPKTWYASTGLANLNLASQQLSIGVLKSIDGGNTWFVAGNSATIFAGARTSGVVMDANAPTGSPPTTASNLAYVAVASGGVYGPGVYKTSDGGATWVNVLGNFNNPGATQNMGYYASQGTPSSLTPMGDAIPLDSVTSLVIDPHSSNRLWAGLGYIGLSSSPGGAGTTGVWFSANSGASWTLVEGADNLGGSANGLPNEVQAFNANQTQLGRVTIAIADGATLNETNVYVLIANPYVDANNAPPPNVEFGSYSGDGNPSGLYKTSDNMLNFTQVMLNQDTNTTAYAASTKNHNFTPIDLFNHDAVNSGALLVDPSNHNVVYVGGSSQWFASTTGGRGNLNHALIRVDTGNMDDGHDPVYSNTGDDKYKMAAGAAAGGNYSFGGSANSSDPYSGEGVYWYDLVEAASGTTPNNPKDYLPPSISTLTFDSNGRLLVGTIGGIWRGVSHGFGGYDFGSGGTGIMNQGKGGFGGPPSFNPPGMSFTSINGNLQIANMTGVAIDPINRDNYFTTQAYTGTAKSTQPLVWESTNLTGPLVNGVNLGIPNAGTVLAANPSPGSIVGTPDTLYRIWQFANQGALIPEYSLDNGVTWNGIPPTGISSNATAGMFPAFAVNPNPVFQSGLYQTNLAFGADIVYATTTSATVWDPISGVLPGGNVSALAFAPSDPNAQTLFAGTTNGSLYYTTNRGGDNWNSTGAAFNAINGIGSATPLPIGKGSMQINGITVDPNNPDEVFVAYKGFSATNEAHLYRGIVTRPAAGSPTITWKAISSTLPGNPQTYAVVIDRSQGLGTSKFANGKPMGKVYVATQIGVFYSTDDGNTWRPLGQDGAGQNSLPNVPVVDLKLDGTSAAGSIANVNGPGGGNPIVVTTTASHGLANGTKVAIAGVTGFSAATGSFTITVIDNTHFSLDGTTAAGSGTGGAWSVPGLQVLAAATQGRGVYTINTSPFSFIPDQVVDQNTASDAIPLTINLPAGLPSTYSYTITAVSTNTNLVQNGPTGTGKFSGINIGGSGQNRTIQFTPVLNHNSPNHDPNNTGGITVTITDSNGFSYAQTFHVTVNFVNQRPTVTAIKDQVTTLGTPFSVNFVVGDVETPANQLDIKVRSSNTTLIPDETDANFNNNLVITGTGTIRTLTVTPVSTGPETTGTAVITLTVTDGGGLVNDPTLATSFNVLVTDTAVLEFQDTFTRADSPFVGPGWVVTSGSARLSQGAASFATGQDIVTLNGLSTANIAQQTDVSLIKGQDLGLVARYDAVNKNYYLGRIFSDAAGNFFAQIAKVLANGTPTILISKPVASGNGTLRFEVADTSLKLYYSAPPITSGTPTLIAFVNDSSIKAAGTAGYFTKSGKVTADNYDATAIDLAAPTLPFSDDFDALANGAQLSPPWVSKVGNFTGNNQSALAAPGSPSLAVIYGLPTSGNTSDFLAQATVNVVGAGNEAGVVARYSAAGFYYAQIKATATGTTASILKFVTGNATPTTLASTSINAIGGAGTLRFEAVGSSLKLFYDDSATVVEVCSAYDSQFANGTTGIRASAGQKIDNFLTDAIQLPAQPASFQDNFSTVLYGNQLGGPSSTETSRDWQYRQGNFQINAANTLQGIAPGLNINLATVNGSLGDTIVQTDYTVGAASGQEAGLVARYNAAGFYLAQIKSTGTGFQANLFKFVTGTGLVSLLSAPLSGVAGTGSAGTTTALRFEVAGSSLKLYRGASLIAYANDSAFPTGSAGLRGTSGSTFQNFSTAALTLTTPTLPFSYDFSNPVNGDQLGGNSPSAGDRNWDERQGNFTENAGLTKATGNAADRQVMVNGVLTAFPANLATVHGVSIADAGVQADFTLSAVGQQAAIVARFQANGNYYLGRIKANTGGTYTATIDKNIGGAVTTLSAITVPATLGFTGVGTLRLEVAGKSLKLFLTPNGGNESLLTYFFDSSITAPGLMGMLVSKNVEVRNFLADNVTITAPTSAPFTDDFSNPVNVNGATSVGQLGGTSPSAAGTRNWDELQGNFADNSVAKTLVGQGTTNLALVHAFSFADEAVQTDITLAASQHAALVARYQVTGNYYMGRITANATATAFTADIAKNIGGTITSLTSVPVPAPLLFTGVGTLRFEVAGTSLKLFLTPNGGAETLLTYIYDSSVTGAGLMGIRSSKGATLENFVADQIALTTPTSAPTFADDFSGPVNVDQIGGTSPSLGTRNWNERQGNFKIVGSDLVGQAATNAANNAANLVTVHGMLLADTISNIEQMDVQTEIALDGGEDAGLLGRYQTTGASAGSFYVGRIIANSTATVFTADISRVSGAGVITKLNTAATTTNPTTGAGTLRFEVAGTSLKLFFTPTGGSESLIAYAYDSALQAAGLTGLRLTKGAEASNFSVSQTTLTSPNLKFIDNFNSSATSQLFSAYSTDWTERRSLFTTQDSVLTAAIGSTVGIATVNGAIADSVMQQTVTLPNTGTHFAGFVTRYNPLTGKSYVGDIVSTAGVLKAEIGILNNGVLTPLSVVNLPSATGTGVMEFDVVQNNLKLFYGTSASTLSLAAFANDSTITGANLSGVYVKGGDSVAEFSLDNLTLTNPSSTTFTDAFTGAGADNKQLSLDWIERRGNFGVVGASVVGKAPNNAAINQANVATVNFTSAQQLALAAATVSADVNIGTGQNVGVIARYQANGSFYLGRLAESGGVFTGAIYRYDVGTKSLVQLKSLSSRPSLGFSSGSGTLTFQVEGANLKLFFTPSGGSTSLAAYAYDNSIATGTMGIWGSLGAGLANFNVTPITIPTSNPSFVENFGSPGFGNQLSSDWQEQAGNFNLATGSAVGQATQTSTTAPNGNIATVNGISAANVDIQGDFNLTAVGQFASVIARYSGTPGKDSYYAATITQAKDAQNNIFYNVEIAKYVNGAKTVLASTTATSFTKTLQLQVVGNNLFVYLDAASNSLLSVTDSSITAAGLLGMRISSAAGVSKFTVTSAS